MQLPKILCSCFTAAAADIPEAGKSVSLFLPASLQPLTETCQVAKESGKCSLQAFSSGDTEKSTGSAGVAR